MLFTPPLSDVTRMVDNSKRRGQYVVVDNRALVTYKFSKTSDSFIDQCNLHNKLETS